MPARRWLRFESFDSERGSERDTQPVHTTGPEGRALDAVRRVLLVSVDGLHQVDWVQHGQDTTSTSSLVTALQSNATAIFADTLPPGTIFTSNITSGPALAAIYGDPNSSDPVAAARAPDVFIEGVQKEGTKVLPGLF